MATNKPKPQNGWNWQCVSDPTEQPAHNYRGDFYGGCFRIYDLRASCDENTWPEGITFRHIRNGKQITYVAGNLVEAQQ